MDEQKAREVLGDAISPNGNIYDLGHYMAWTPGQKDITLDSQFSVEELEAIVWWMKNNQRPNL